VTNAGGLSSKHDDARNADWLDVARNHYVFDQYRDDDAHATLAALIAIADELRKINTREDQRDRNDDARRELWEARRNTWTGA
jgi:hypothetical protein